MSSRTRRTVIALIVLLLALVIILLTRCSRPDSTRVTKSTAVERKAQSAAATAVVQPTTTEVLTAATVRAPAQIEAGASFRANWTGPDNPGDYLIIVRPTAKPEAHGNYRETRYGASVDLAAPIEAGEWEVRYVAAKSKTVLARAPITVLPTVAVLSAPDEVVLGAPVSVSWTGPNNAGDFICIVRKGTPDTQVGNFGEVAKGSPMMISAPVESGEAEIRYITGQGRKVIARRRLVVLEADVALKAQSSVVAGTRFSVEWRGPANAGDYVTVVPHGTPDGQYRSYADVSKRSPVELTAPIEPGEAEIRYLTGKQARVLARKPISVVAATITMEAPDEIVAGAPVSIHWSGPKNAGDYITVVPKATPDGQYGNYADVTKGSPLKVTAPMHAGLAEMRYMSGSGAKVLARRSIAVVPAKISLTVPQEAAPGAFVEIEWSGPDNAGDYLTIVPKSAKDGVAGRVVYTSKGSPLKIQTPTTSGECEARYVSGQNNIVLARAPVLVR